MMFYRRQCRAVVDEFKEGSIPKEVARERLGNIEEEAYRRIPDAVPDGDITFAVASALDEIEAISREKKQIHLLVMDDGISHKIEGAFFSGRRAQELATRYNGEDDAEGGCGPYDVVSVEIEDAEDVLGWVRGSSIEKRGDQTMYGIGIEHKPGEFGMNHGLFEIVKECLAIEGVEGSCIIRFNQDGSDDVIYRWDSDECVWGKELVEELRERRI